HGHSHPGGRSRAHRRASPRRQHRRHTRRPLPRRHARRDRRDILRHGFGRVIRMNYLAPERSTLEQYLPGLDDKLTDVDLETLEQPGNPVLSWFRAAHGPRLVIPEENSGLESPLLDAIRVQRAIGSRSPSLAVATTMHHFSVASIVELSRQGAGL